MTLHLRNRQSIDVNSVSLTVLSLGVTFYHRQELVAMVFSSIDKVIIQNDVEEKGWTAYKICKEHSMKKWDYSSVKRLVNRFKERGTMDRKKVPVVREQQPRKKMQI